MSRHTTVRLVILGKFLYIIFVLIECKKLDGYKFPVYSTPFCPGNESEWKKRSTVLNCNETNGYTCLPNENFTELLEFCYIEPWIWIQEGYCLYLERKCYYVDSYSCRHFVQGCHNTSYQSIRIYEHPACISLGNGCFLAEQSCKSFPKTTHDPTPTENAKNDLFWVVILIGIIVFISCFSILILYLYLKKIVCKQRHYNKDVHESGQNTSLIKHHEHEMIDTFFEESQKDEAMFERWKQEDSSFISTKASKEVEKCIKNNSLVIVAGHPGSGKSAIIQNIALKYKKQRWTVRQVKKVEDIMDSSKLFQKDKTIFVVDDPLGKEHFNERLYNSWKTYEKELKLYLKTAKFLMSCRSHIISDSRLTRYFVNQLYIVDLDNNNYKLSVDEKRHILRKYTSDINLSENECDEIVTKVDMHFPLLCRLYFSKEEDKNKGIGKVSPLCIACEYGHDIIVQVLLKNKADINVCTKKEASPLFIACKYGHHSTVQLLLDNKADFNLCKNKVSPLYIACQKGHESTVKLLLDIGADINNCTKSDASPLIIACQNGHESTVKHLLNNRARADINLCTNDGVSPLYIACQNENQITVELLLENKADINSCAKNGASPLYIACQNGNRSTAQLLLKNKADINLCPKNGASPLYIACQNGHQSTVQLLLEYRADINLCLKNGASPLYIACQNGHRSIVQLLLKNGADINLCKEIRVSPLTIACKNGHDGIVQLLRTYKHSGTLSEY